MNLFTPQEVTANYAAAGAAKTNFPIRKMLLLGILSGLIIGLAAAVANTAAHDIANVGIARLVMGVIFPFGLGMVVVSGAELFTGNCLIPISVLDGKTSLAGLLKNWFFVYAGNFAGGLLTAAGCVFFGQLNYSANALAAFTIRVAAAKCSLPFANALVSGIFCNFLVCVGVFLALASKDVPGRFMGTYLPVAFFVICGFEHSVANMYYIPAGLMALQVPAYAAKAAEMGLSTAALTWGRFFTANLIPVTLGNIVGGAGFACMMWACHLYKGGKS
ncbi:MAG: formate/nitrite transporter family protein [Spirochaetaceae bacterium]|nr:formate/nitrite transporter family protein [Spirochaetaceae bacterium]